LETAEYTLACHDDTAVAAVKERLSYFKDNVKYATFTPGQSLENQPLKDKKFDIVLAFNVSGRQNIDFALSNAKFLLNAGGELCLVEITNSALQLAMHDSSIISR
jgi:hypothetical protein